MARIFLSYAREDLARARAIAKFLERSGHAVWWDSQVQGGARFVAEIDRALKDADVVIVLWSRSSVQSTWVHDEAGEGRDSGRLLPVSLDDSKPPLGFRQFQAIDLSKWTGKGRPPNLAAIEAAIATVLKGGTLAGPAESAKRDRSWFDHWAGRALAAAVALVLIAAAALYGTGRFAARAEVASLAVLPFTDLSPARDKAYFAEGVAEEIRTLLASVPGVKVVGRTSIAMLGPGVALKEASQQLGVTHMLEGSMRIQGQQMRLNVRLIRTADGVQIWAERFDRDLNDIFKVQQQIGSAVAEHLRYRLWSFPLAERTRTSAEVYDLVLASRSKMGRSYDGSLESHRLAQQAVRLDPKYSPAWVELSRSIFAIDQTKPEGLWGAQWPAQRERALRYARRAVELDPTNGDAQAFLGWVEADGERPELALRRIHKAMDLNPGEASVWGIASLIYGQQLCDRKRELEALRRYIALEPLDLASQVDQVQLLYGLGDTAEADELRRKLAQTDNADLLEFRLASQRGDYSSALAARLKKQPKGRGIFVAWNLSGLDKFGPAIEWLPSGYRDSLGAYWLGDYPKVAAQSDFIPTTQWNNARTIAIERALISTGQHAKLLDMFDKRFRSIEEFDRRLRCHLPTHAAPIAVALQRAGRTAEANRLISMAERRYRQSGSYSIAADHAGYVQLLVVAGRYDDALTALDRVQRITRGWEGGPPVLWLNLQDPIYDPIRNHPRFKAVEARIAAWRAKELRELAAAGVKV